jgi:transposase
MELPNDIEALKKIIETQAHQIEFLLSELSALQARLNKNSSNSSKPPSSDGYRKVAKIIAPKNGTKGGQKEHKGNTLHQVEAPDEIQQFAPIVCDCGYHFTPSALSICEKRQLFDLPKPKLFITEHQIFKATCPCCGQIQVGSSPLKAPVQYGNGIKTLASMLNIQYKMPLKKIKQFFSDSYGVPINESTIQTSNILLYQQLSETENIIKARIKCSSVANADETGIRIDKKLHWIHTISTTLFTYLFAHAKRGTEAIHSEKGFLYDFSNWLVHDCWSSYFGLDKVKHALCGAHILRELQGIIDDTASKYATKMQHFLLEVYKTAFPDRLKNKENIIAEYRKICAEWETEEPLPQRAVDKRGKTKKTKARNLLERLIAHQEKVLAFAFNEHVPFTNNLAERNLRAVKLKQKISNCFRSFHSAEIYARIERFISTCRKNDKNIYNEVYNSFNGYNFLQ